MNEKRNYKLFIDGNSYTNVYFLKIDASGHSNLVLNNPADLTNKLFDLFENTVYSTVDENKKLYNCKYSEFWGWQGDGGLCVFYDNLESVALKAAILSAFNILDFKLDWLRDSLKKLNVKGQLSIRIAVHKGSFEYKGDDRHGSIHSKDLNFVSHLETVTPRDSLTISEDVYRACPQEFCSKFSSLDFKYEDHNIYIYSKQISTFSTFEWINNLKIGSAFKGNIFPQRLSELEKSLIIKNAKNDIIDLGTALNTCSYYLVSTQRPTHYRNEVLRLLDQGVNYTCLVLNPEAEITNIYSSQRNEKLKEKISSSLERLIKFGQEVKGKKGEFKIFLYSQMPYFASILLDKNENGLALFSPYMPNFKNLNIERADTIHLLISKETTKHFFNQIKVCNEFLLNDSNTNEVIVS